MSNKEFIKKVSNVDDKNLLKLYYKYKKEVSSVKKDFNKSMKENYETSYINVKLNELEYLFTTEKLKHISNEIKQRGILV